MKKIGTLFLLLFSLSGAARVVEVTDEITVKKLTANVYLYVAWADVGSWGRVGSNGLIVVDKKKAFLIDTPMHESQTVSLVGWIESSLGAKVVGFVPGHWHDDCVGGLAYLNRIGVETYSGARTDEILRAQGAERTKKTFADSVSLDVNGIQINCYYLGGGHATDNIVVWIPSRQVLFGGCMLKDCQTTGLGNVADAAPFYEWLNTVQVIRAKFPTAKIIVPGHGEIGKREILDHTEQILKANCETID